ncbi:hypothetical protein P3X46_001807 [Hevea brasiliensis]|uniref:Uncharacterized protein n=1 Tax=Hevea brasiliensis TaxID=3981 RepID=A0ABQ9NFV5_HEVBR|nr:hypothetical protein P3X46_001807 [Hevea brasiliensis]
MDKTGTGIIETRTEKPLRKLVEILPKIWITSKMTMWIRRVARIGVGITGQRIKTMIRENLEIRSVSMTKIGKIEGRKRKVRGREILIRKGEGRRLGIGREGERERKGKSEGEGEREI